MTFTQALIAAVVALAGVIGVLWRAYLSKDAKIEELWRLLLELHTEVNINESERNDGDGSEGTGGGQS